MEPSEANRIPLDLVAVYFCHIRRTHGPTLDGQYRTQKTGTKPVQVQRGSPFAFKRKATEVS
jgi:hypothetical protein